MLCAHSWVDLTFIYLCGILCVCAQEPGLSPVIVKLVTRFIRGEDIVARSGGLVQYGFGEMAKSAQ